MLKYLLLLTILPIILVATFSDTSSDNKLYTEINTINSLTLLDVYATEHNNFPLSIWTDKTYYSNGETIIITGNINDYDSFEEIKLTYIIKTPDNNIIRIGEIFLNSDGSFEKSIVAGGPLWKLTGYYITEFNYGTISGEIIINYMGNKNIPVNPIYTPLTITTDKRSYLQGETISITGQTPTTYNGQLIISLSSPIEGQIDTLDNITINNNQFATSMNTGNNTSIQIAESYTLTAIYGTDTASTTFDYGYPIPAEDEYFIPSSEYIVLSDQQITKWTNQITQWENAQNRTDTKIDRLYDKLDRAITRNQTDKIEQWTIEIGHTMALSSLYDRLIECLEEQIELLS